MSFDSKQRRIAWKKQRHWRRWPRDRASTHFLKKMPNNWRFLIGPDVFRRDAMFAYIAQCGIGEFVRLISQLAGVVLSVEEHAQQGADQATRQVIAEAFRAGAPLLHLAFRGVNMPTVAGALYGATKAIREPGMCNECAFRLGSGPNQRLVTLFMADRGGEPFYCHKHTDEEGNGTRTCAGWQALHACEPEVATK